jgi:ClpP class serine protease
MRARSVRHVEVTAASLARARSSGVLAIDLTSLGGFVALAAEAPDEPYETRTDQPTIAVAVVYIDGPLAQRAMIDVCAYVDGYDAVGERLDAAHASEAEAILLVIDSPGGDSAGLSEGIARMQASNARSGKPVIAYVDELAASAAYAIASGVASEIFVPTSGRVGSIGCYAAYADESKAWEAEGIKWTVAREPAGKAEMMPIAPIHDLANKRLADRVHRIGERFYAQVSASRDIPVETIRKMNGALFEGQDAVEQKLANQVGSFEDALARAQALAQERRTAKAKPAAQSTTRLTQHEYDHAQARLALGAPRSR